MVASTQLTQLTQLTPRRSFFTSPAPSLTIPLPCCLQLLQDVARLRFSMYAVFIVVPQGLVRRLATQKHKLTDDEVDDDDDDDINPKLMVRVCFA